MANEITYTVEPGYYLQPFSVQMVLSQAIESIQFSVNGGAPSISKYIAYDTLVPANPFIAVTQDGRGNVVYDGGFPKFYNGSAPSANIVPFDNAIRAQAERTSVAGNGYCYLKLSDEAVNIVAGDKLVYDVWSSSAVAQCGVDAFVNGLEATSLRSIGLLDQNGVNCHPSTDISARASGKWYHREFALGSQAGSFINNWMIAFENDTAGVHVAYFKEAYVLNSAGQIKATLFKDTLNHPSGTLGATGKNLMIGESTRKVDVRDQLTASYKYLFNALRFCENKTKVAGGNKKILIIGDASVSIHANYRVKGVGINDFMTSFTRIAAIAGYIPTFKEGYDWSGASGVINPTIAELEQYCAVIFMSSVHQAAAAPYLISPESVDAMLTYRENGNGLIFITDHGPIINTIQDATSSNKGGFFATANAVVSGFGAWFSGDYSRTPVNVGFLRTTYGDHPLYDSMLDTESIYAGGSESRVNVATFASVAPEDVPIIQIGDGKTTIQVAAVLDTGEIVTSRVVFWVVDFSMRVVVDGVPRNNGQTVDIGVKNKAAVSADVEGTLTENASGILYHKNVNVAGVSFTPAGGMTLNFTGGNSLLKFNDGDELRLAITTPFTMTVAVIVKRFQPELDSGVPLPDVLKVLRVWKPLLTDIERMSLMVRDIAAVYPGLGIAYRVEYPANLKLIKDHFSNEGPTST